MSKKSQGSNVFSFCQHRNGIHFWKCHSDCDVPHITSFLWAWDGSRPLETVLCKGLMGCLLGFFKYLLSSINTMLLAYADIFRVHFYVEVKKIRPWNCLEMAHTFVYFSQEVWKRALSKFLWSLSHIHWNSWGVKTSFLVYSLELYIFVLH